MTADDISVVLSQNGMDAKMETIRIWGGRPLRGTIPCAGMKNAAVAVILATILTADRCILENLPIISDVEVALGLLEELGAEVVRLNARTVSIDTEPIYTHRATGALAGRMRASYYLLGALLGRFGEAEVGIPGGCDFVERPIDQHQKGLAALGAQIVVENGVIKGTSKQKGGCVRFDKVSVGATINTMLAAVCAEGESVLIGAAREPHVVDVADFLNACGARIYGAGTDTIRIVGVPTLHGTVHAVVPDMIEAGTYLIAAVATGGSVRVEGVVPAHLSALTELLLDMGARVEIAERAITASAGETLRGLQVETAPYPGFPTDLQPQMAVLLAMAEGGGTLTEGVWDHRFRYVNELAKLGVHASVQGKRAVFAGEDHLYGAEAQVVDLRAGAALIVAGLVATGETTLTNVSHIHRGYECIIEKLRAVGAVLA